MAAGVIGAALALLVAYGVVGEAKATLWGTFLTMLIPVVQGWTTRHFVMPVSKIKDAGLAPETITHRAEVANGGR